MGKDRARAVLIHRIAEAKLVEVISDEMRNQGMDMGDVKNLLNLVDERCVKDKTEALKFIEKESEGLSRISEVY